MNQGTILGRQTGRWIILAVLVAALGALLFLLPGGLVQAQDSTTIEYTENSTDVVATLTAGDPEGATPITWSLPRLVDDQGNCTAVDPDGADNLTLTLAAAADNCVFKIDPLSGVLEFLSSPDYDDPGDAGGNNVYNAVVQATDGDAGNNIVAGTARGEIATGVNMVDDDDTRSWFKVIVNVQDINEPGSIKLHPTGHERATLLQPQIGVEITAAMLMDEDGIDPDSATGISAETGEEATYQWQRSSSRNGPWENITLPAIDTTPATYIPRQLDGGERDLSKYLRVVATYTEAGTGGRGGQRAIATSMYPTIKIVGDNNDPLFTEGDATTRPVRENRGDTNIGARVAATNAESIAPHNEKLTYWLSGANGTAVGTAIENITETLTPAPVADEAETTDAGVDQLFSIDPATGQLMTKTGLNYETNPYYGVIVNVADSSSTTGAEATAGITVIIRVLQTNDEPEIDGASTIEHVEGGTVLDTDLSNNTADVATYDATDEDPTDTTLEFSMAGADEDLFNLRDTTPAEEEGDGTPPGTTRQVLEFKEKPDFENPMDAKKDNVYQVTVKVFDGEDTTTKDVTVKVTNKQEEGKVEVRPLQARIGIELTAALTDSDIVAYGPMWQWERRMLAAADVTASCADADAETTPWMRIPGARSATFAPRDIDLGHCLRAVATYNDGYHEDPLPDVVTPSSPSSIGLYTDADTRFDKTANKVLSSVQYPTEPNVVPKFGSAMTKRFVLENAAANNPVGKPVTATDGNGPDDALEYELRGATDAFSIHPVTGQLMTKMKLNHESEDKYTVTVTAKDTHQATVSIRVEIYVVDVDEMPPVGGMLPEGGIPYNESRTDGVVTLSASDPEGATPITWSLPRMVDQEGTCTAIDPDGADNLTLTLAAAADNCVFKIDPLSGVLEFLSSPDYDDSGDAGGNNVYNAVVQATDGDAGNNIVAGTARGEIATGVNMVDDDDTRSWFKVIVNVQDINEPGSIKLRPTGTEHERATLLQPQIGVEITAAMLMDEDGIDPDSATGISAETGEEATYQWQRSSSRNGPWENITLPAIDTTPATYIPRQLDGGERDLSKYLRVEATYTEAGTGGRGGQRAIATSMYPTIETVGDNNDPLFTEGDATTRPVRENRGDTNIGARVAATNAESIAPHNEKLTYWLSGANGTAVGTAIENITETLTPAPVADEAETTDAGVDQLFSIDPATGQLMTKTGLNYETNPYYGVIVNVADSSSTTGAEATAGITVIIRVLQTNDEPEIDGASTIEHVEGGTVLDTDLSNNTADVATYDATDEDPTDTTLEFSMAGADEDLFNLRDTTPAEEEGDGTPPGTTRQVLEFKEKPDFENPMDAKKDNVYQVTVKVFDGEDTTTKDVTVKVTNKQEEGKVEVRPLQARIGIELTAALTDSDIVAYGPMWQWERRMLAAADVTASCADADAETTPWMRIPGARSATFAPRDIDLGHCLRAVATYNDGYHEDPLPDVVTPSSPSSIGLYTDADTRFDKTANKVLSSVQYPTEPNVVPKFGSAMTKRFVLENAAANNPVGKPVTATDGNGPDDALEYELRGTTDAFSIHPVTGQLMTKMKFNHESEDKYTVTVMAKDTHQATASIKVEIYVVDVDEMPPISKGGLAILGTSSVNYMESGTMTVATYAASGTTADNARWRLMGDDAGDFRLEPTTGKSSMLKFRNPPDYENPMDSGSDNTYNVVVQATDGTYTVMKNVMVVVTNEGELGTPSGPISSSHMENSTEAVATYTVWGTMADDARWTLEDDADFDHFTLDGTTGMSTMLKFRSPPDYESPMGGADNDSNTYMVTVKAEAGGETAMVQVTVEVTNVDELGTLSGSTSASIMEGATDSLGTYTLMGTAADTADWSLDGADMSDFMLEGTGMSRMLKFSSAPDYESPMGGADNDSNTYMVTVMASASGETAMVQVTVEVTNVDELGTLSGSTSASIMEGATDSLGTYTLMGTAADTADWSLDGADMSDFMLEGTGMSRMLKFSSAPDYESPMGGADNDSNTYMVTVMASAGGEMVMVEVTVEVTNVDELGTLSGSTSASIMEGATDSLGTYTLMGTAADTADWSLDGADMSDFMLEGTGMSRMLKFSSAPDYESPMGGADNDSNTYMVTVMASAGGETAMVQVTVEVTNVDELGTLSGSTSASIMEGATDSLSTYTLMGTAADTADWSLDGADMSDFMLEGTGMSRMLKFSSAPDYESPMGGADNDSNTYMVTVMASAGGEMVMVEVTVEVTNVDELGTLSGSTSASIMEGATDSLGTYTLMGTAADTADWSLDGADMSDFMLEGTGMSRMLKFSSAPDYESPMGGADNDSNTYMVTVMASAGGETAMVQVTVEVTNVDEAGTVTLMPASPMVDTAVTAALTDPDGTTTSISWDWLISMDDEEYTAIPGETTAMYTPTAEDATKYIKARAMYNDPEGANKVADSDPAMVTVADPLLAEYDTNKNGTIDRSEAIAAIRGYLAGEAGFSRAEVIAVLRLYLGS